MREAVGQGSCEAHHGEILQGLFQLVHGREPVHGVVSLPCSRWTAWATFEPWENQEIRVEPEGRTKALRAAELTRDALDLAVGGLLRIDSPIPLGRGLGSSTADVVSAVRAVAASAGVSLAATVEAQLAVRAEGASDTVMFADRALLYANRNGFVLEDYRQQLPGLLVVGFDDGRPPVSTDGLATPPYTDAELAVLDRQRVRLRSAIRLGCARCVAEVSSVSAHINQRYRPSPYFMHLQSIAAASGALGYQSAHSGTAFGLLFDAASPGAERLAVRAARLLRSEGLPDVYRFTTNPTAEAISRVAPEAGDRRGVPWAAMS